MKSSKTKKSFVNMAMDEEKRENRLHTLQGKLKLERALVVFSGVLVIGTLIYVVIQNDPFSPSFLISLIICLFTNFSCEKVVSEIKLLQTISALQDWFADAADL